jgi:hypothetical protein
VYTTCGFCSGALGGDGSSSGLTVGKRFAYDAWKSRAWVICQRCGRWNLTPFDSRIETIEALERMAAAGKVAATSDQVSLIRSGSYDVVRVGQPRRVELASWRYGERMKARERERLKVLVPIIVVFVGATIAFNAALGGSFGYMIGQVPGMADNIYTGMVGRRKVNIEPPICASCGNVMVLRAKHIRHARLTETTHHDLALLLSCPLCNREGALLEGTDAELALRSGLTYVNLKKARKLRKKAPEAASYLDRHGGAEAFIRNSARLELTVARLQGAEALALEMAVDEQGELRELKRQWRQAEEIAHIADNLTIGPAVEEEFRRLKEGNQPPG